VLHCAKRVTHGKVRRVIADPKPTTVLCDRARPSNEIFNIEIVSVETAIKLQTVESLRLKQTCIVIPDFPELEAEVVNRSQRSPVTEQLLRCFRCSVSARMEFDHELFNVGETSRVGKYSVKRCPLRTLDINLQNVDRRLQCQMNTIQSCTSIIIIFPLLSVAIQTRRSYMGFRMVRKRAIFSARSVSARRCTRVRFRARIASSRGNASREKYRCVIDPNHAESSL